MRFCDKQRDHTDRNLGACRHAGHYAGTDFDSHGDRGSDSGADDANACARNGHRGDLAECRRSGPDPCRAERSDTLSIPREFRHDIEMHWFLRPELATADDRGLPHVEGGVSQHLLGTTKRGDGATQVTYNGRPLHYFIADAGPGTASGEGINAFGARWEVVTAAGVGR